MLWTDLENKGGEIRRISVGEELFVNLLESLLRQLAIWTVSNEAFVPLLYLLLSDCQFHFLYFLYKGQEYCVQ